MTKSLIIERTINAINQLPEEKAVEISDFAEFIMKRFDDQRLLEGIQKSHLTVTHLTFFLKKKISIPFMI